MRLEQYEIDSYRTIKAFNSLFKEEVGKKMIGAEAIYKMSLLENTIMETGYTEIGKAKVYSQYLTPFTDPIYQYLTPFTLKGIEYVIDKNR